MIVFTQVIRFIRQNRCFFGYSSEVNTIRVTAMPALKKQTMKRMIVKMTRLEAREAASMEATQHSRAPSITRRRP